MYTKQRLPRWAVVLGVAAAFASGCGDDLSSTRTGATAISTTAQTGSTTEPTATQTDDTPEPTATQTDDTSPEATATQPDASPEATEAPSAPTAVSTADPGGATTAPACPTDEFPAVGASSIADGAVVWLVCSPVEASRTVIGANDDIVLIEESGPFDASGSASRYTIAFDADDGSELWRIETEATGTTFTPAGPIDGQGIVVLSDQGAGTLVGIDVLSGEERWSVESSDGLLANSPTVAVVWDAASQSSPTGFRGIDRATGEELWVSDTMLSDQSGNMVGRSPAAVLDEVMAVPTGATLTAIDMPTGAILWQSPQLDDPAAADGTFVGARRTSGPPTVAAIDAASGEERWTAPGSASYGDLLAVGDGVIAVMDAGENRGLDLIAYELSSGDERWQVTQTSHIAQPQMIDGTSLIMLWEGEFSVLSTTDGSTIWGATEPFGSTWMNSVGSNGDTVFVAINSRPFSD
jgi:outer membrane protein assembly factor BamB